MAAVKDFSEILKDLERNGDWELEAQSDLPDEKRGFDIDDRGNKIPLAKKGVRVERDVFGRVSAKHRSAWKYRNENFGKNYNLLTGEEVLSKYPVPVPPEVTPAIVEYTDFTVDGKGDIIDEDGNIFDTPGDYWKLTTSSERLSNLTTFFLQSTVCAAINSKTRLVWWFGVDRDMKIEGCYFNYGDRRTFVKGLEFALSREFFPALPSSLVKIQVIQVEHPFQDNCCVIKMTLDTIIPNMYQLSSGRVFFRVNGAAKQTRSLDEGRRILREKRKAEHAADKNKKMSLRLPISFLPDDVVEADLREGYVLAGVVGAALLLGFVVGRF